MAIMSKMVNVYCWCHKLFGCFTLVRSTAAGFCLYGVAGYDELPYTSILKMFSLMTHFRLHLWLSLSLSMTLSMHLSLSIHPLAYHFFILDAVCPMHLSPNGASCVVIGSLQPNTFPGRTNSVLTPVQGKEVNYSLATQEIGNSGFNKC